MVIAMQCMSARAKNKKIASQHTRLVALTNNLVPSFCLTSSVEHPVYQVTTHENQT